MHEVNFNFLLFHYYYHHPHLYIINRYGVRDVVSDVISYDDAQDCRKDATRCGIDGIYFEKVPNLQLKMIAVKINDFTTDPNFAFNTFSYLFIGFVFRVIYGILSHS